MEREKYTFLIPIADWILLYTSFSANICTGIKIAAKILARNQPSIETKYDCSFWDLVR